MPWDELVLGPVMAIFGEGRADDPSSLPVYRSAAVPLLRLASAVFDESYQRIYTLEDGSTTSSSHPVLGVRDELFAALPSDPRQGACIDVPSNGKSYRISDVQPDGHGHTLLLLIESGT